MSGLPARVRLVEVGPRDGLQNEPCALPAATRVTLVEKLAAAGIDYIEAGSFVSPRWVPQMAESLEVLQQLRRSPGVTYAALTPNLRGLESALEAGADEVAVFTAASETFVQRNINCSIDESFARFVPLLERARSAGVPVRGYVSTVVACPYEGPIAAAQVADVAVRLADLGCREISLGDTIGVGTPTTTRKMLEAVAQRVPMQQLAVHFHDTYGQALANIYACMQAGVTVIDSAIAGLGGCPYADGASGNVATEDVLYMLDGLGIATGIRLDAAIDAGQYIANQLGRPGRSRAAQAILHARQRIRDAAK